MSVQEFRRMGAAKQTRLEGILESSSWLFWTNYPILPYNVEKSGGYEV